MSDFLIKKVLDNFDFSFQPSIDKYQIAKLATMRFLENRENVDRHRQDPSSLRSGSYGGSVPLLHL